jgi:histidinol dehydrogenase
MFTVYTKQTLGDLIKKLKDRADNTNDDIEKSVKNILADVKARGDKALFEYSEKFDKVALKSLRMSESEKEEAIAKVPAELKATIDKAAENIRAFHEKQKANSWISNENGKIMGQRVLPLRRVGLYVPGGSAAYPSSVLMNAIPAKVAFPNTSRTNPIRKSVRVKPIPIPTPSSAESITVFLLANISARPRMIQLTTMSAR